MKIWKIQFNEFFDQLQDLLTSGQSPREIGAFIEGIDDDINWRLPWKTQHVHHTVFELVNIGLSYVARVIQIYLGENTETSIRIGRKLRDEGGEETIAILLLDISKIEIIVGHRGQPSRM
jgi:hypothetical protein